MDTMSIIQGLKSIGYASLSDGSSCYLVLKNERQLVEQISRGTDAPEERLVTSSSRDVPSAVYMIGETHTFVVYADDTGALKASKLDVVNNKWSETQLSGVDTSLLNLHGQSRIGTASLPGGAIVFFQRSDGTVHSILFDETSQTWSDGFTVPNCRGKAGTPIATFAIPDALVVAFLTDDGALHCHCREFATGDQTDHVIRDISFDAVENFTMSYDGAFKAFILLPGNELRQVVMDSEFQESECVSTETSGQGQNSTTSGEDLTELKPVRLNRESGCVSTGTSGQGQNSTTAGEDLPELNHLRASYVKLGMSSMARVKVQVTRQLLGNRKFLGGFLGAFAGTIAGNRVNRVPESRETPGVKVQQGLINIQIEQRNGHGGYKSLGARVGEIAQWGSVIRNVFRK